MIRLVFLGSKPIGYYCLKHILENFHNKTVFVQGILTNDNSTFSTTTSLRQLASEYNVPIYKSLIELPDTDILYSVQYHEILKPQHIAKAKKVALNLHMAPLPEYRGCNQFSFAILDEAQEFGATIHILDEKIDHGDIVFEKRFEIPSDCWIQELYTLTYDASLHLFKESLENILLGNYNRIPQQDLIPIRGCSIHYRKEINDIKKIDLSWERERIERHVRATAMPGFEPPYTYIDNHKFFFKPAEQ